MLKDSALGLEFKNGPSLAKDLIITKVQDTQVDETWTQVWGEEKNIRNQYNQLQVDLVGDEHPEQKADDILPRVRRWNRDSVSRSPDNQGSITSR